MEKSEEDQLVEEVREFLRKEKDNHHLCQEFIGAVRNIIKEYLKEPTRTTDTVKRSLSNSSYKTIKSNSVLTVFASAKKSQDKITELEKDNKKL